MCRLFGFRSTIELPVHHSLQTAENALAHQSHKHCDGWGLAYYRGNECKLLRSAQAAHQDEDFHWVAQAISANTVLAHVRLATIGPRKFENTHPFHHQNWTFAHNGEIENFGIIKDQFLSSLPEPFQALIEGETDSEVIFFHIMNAFHDFGLIDASRQQNYELPAYRNAIRTVIQRVLTIQPKLLLNFVLTDGNVFFAYRHGKAFYYSTRKKYCAKSNTCGHAGPNCFDDYHDLSINTHCMVSSEPISQEDIWEEIPQGSLLMTDSQLHVSIEPLGFDITPSKDP